MVEKIKKLEKQLKEEKWKNTKLMWQYANWEWRLIILLGIIYLGDILFRFSNWLIK